MEGNMIYNIYIWYTDKPTLDKQTHPTTNPTHDKPTPTKTHPNDKPTPTSDTHQRQTLANDKPTPIFFYISF